MACINPNDPKFKEILARVGNPLLAEIEFEKYLSSLEEVKLIMINKIIKDISRSTYTFTFNPENDSLYLVPQPEVKMTKAKARNAIERQASRSNQKNSEKYTLGPVITYDWKPSRIQVNFNPKFLESQIQPVYEQLEEVTEFVQGKSFDKELAKKIQDILQKLYPEIKLNITNKPVWSKANEVFNQIIENEFGEEYWRDLYTKNSLTNSKDFILIDIPTIENKFAPDFENVYHGTNTYEIDNKGNLILIPSQNFGNKTTSISFTQIPVVAQDYMLRKKGNFIIKINNEALGSNYNIESAEEIAINTSGLFVVPNGQFEILNVDRFEQEKKINYQQEIEEEIEQFRNISSDFLMLDAIYRAKIDAANYDELKEYSEFDYSETTPDWYISEEHISKKAANIVYEEIKHKIKKDWIIKNFADALIDKIKRIGIPMLNIEDELYKYSEYAPDSPHSDNLFSALTYELFKTSIITGKDKETYDEIVNSIKKIVDAESQKAINFYNSPEQINLRKERNEKLRLEREKREKLRKEFLEGENLSIYPELPFQKIGDLIIGQANIKAMTVLIDAINQKQDTLPHEYAHHYIAWFRNTPIVQEAIKKWGSEEALVQSIGEQVVKQKGEALDWWTKFTKWVMNLFDNLSTKDKQELTNILTDAFLQRIDLRTGKVGFEIESIPSIQEAKIPIDQMDRIIDNLPPFTRNLEDLGFQEEACDL